jgi:hypothetical protein
MSRKRHIYPNGTKVEVLFEGVVVGTGKIVEHLVEPDDMYPNKTHLYYRVEIERSELERFLDLDKEHWLNDFEVRPIK